MDADVTTALLHPQRRWLGPLAACALAAAAFVLTDDPWVYGVALLGTSALAGALLFRSWRSARTSGGAPPDVRALRQDRNSSAPASADVPRRATP